MFTKAGQIPRVFWSTMILSKPGVILSVAFVGYVGMVVAQKGPIDITTVFPVILSLLFSSSGAAILNNIFDKDIDQIMGRVRGRAMLIESVGEGYLFIQALFFITFSLSLSFLLINFLNGILTLLAIVSYLFLYTIYLKRQSPYSTIIGGISGALPVLIGYSAVNTRLGLDGIILFIMILLWQPPHFWSLALQYQDDYQKAAVPVLPMVLNTDYTKIHILLYTVALIPISLSLWFFGYVTVCQAVVSLGMGLVFLYLLAKYLFMGCFPTKAFRFSILYLWAIMLTIAADILIFGS
jgi:protoheme IX farnesyltransferase